MDGDTVPRDVMDGDSNCSDVCNTFNTPEICEMDGCEGCAICVDGDSEQGLGDNGTDGTEECSAVCADFELNGMPWEDDGSTEKYICGESDCKGCPQCDNVGNDGPDGADDTGN
eukprot:6056114-Ditylum_brightwellii.AAC.1